MTYMFLSMKPCQYLASDFLVLGLGTFLATYVDVISAPNRSERKDKNPVNQSESGGDPCSDNSNHRFSNDLHFIPFYLEDRK